MGILNKTCSISNTPILDGQKIRIFFLASCRGRYQQQSALFSNTESYFLPNVYSQYNVIGGIGIEAVVDDEEYCSFSFDHESLQAKYILKQISKRYYMLDKEAESKNHKSLANEESFNISRENLTFENVLSMIEQGDLYVSSILRSDVLDSVSIMAVHEDVYQMLLGDSQKEYTREDGYVQMTFDYFFNNEMKKKIKWNEVNEEKVKRQKERFDKLNLNSVSDEDMDRKTRLLVYGMNKFGHDYETSYSFNGTDPYSGMLMFSLETDTTISEEEIFKKTVEEKFFMKKLDEYNLMLRPTITSGEDRDYEQFINFYDKLKNVIVEINKRETDEED